MSAAILVVEDNDDDFIALMRVFDKGGVRNPVWRCCCGEEALDCLLEYGNAGSRPGMILLDLNLPGTDGMAVLSAIRADAGLRDIPVVVLTASFAREDIQRCYDAGADSYLLKPVVMDGLIKAMGRLGKPFDLALAPPRLGD